MIHRYFFTVGSLLLIMSACSGSGKRLTTAAGAGDTIPELSSGLSGPKQTPLPEGFFEEKYKTTTTSPDCGTPLSASLRPIAPNVPHLSAGVVTTWEVTASGCFSDYTLDLGDGTAPRRFSGKIEYTRIYSTVGLTSESVKVNALNSSSATIATATLRSSTFMVNDPTVSNPNNSEPPKCALIRTGSPVTSPAQPISLFLSVTGTFSGASINGQSATPNTIVAVLPNLSGHYNASAEVQGTGGTGYCAFQYTPPSCSLAVKEKRNGATDLVMTLKGEVSYAMVNGVPQTLPVLPLNTITYTQTTVSAAAVTTTGLVQSPVGDRFECTAAFQACGPETVAAYIIGGQANGIFNDCSSGTTCNPFGYLWTQTLAGAPLLIASSLKAGDRVKVESLTGQISWAANRSCLDDSADSRAPYWVPVAQMTNANNAVQYPGFSTMGGFNAILLRDLRNGADIPVGVSRIYAGYADSYYGDNSGSCTFNVRVTPKCEM